MCKTILSFCVNIEWTQPTISHCHDIRQGEILTKVLKKKHIALPEEDKSYILNVTFDVHSADAVIPGVVRRRRKQLLHVAVSVQLYRYGSFSSC